ncbi:cysteine hydrolase [Sphingomonas sp. BIUV-7]|uniref:Cysteine hydrolase n=1 Tax=Sphingomonas natans TaxID=3063330 RepID=A0ABT8YEI3_9SPHN|nr:cysteine hydrolase [Sphingomonas sp. BIUV-7]MDO6416726.1 cysteine hydrolase [Sphingomonas sp. BIUV-7]
MMTHNWSIPEREYARQEQRRGRRHAFSHLAPRSTALVVVDMVPFFAGNKHSADVIENINRIAAPLRDAGGTIAWVIPSSDDPYPDLSNEFYGREAAEAFRVSGGQGPLESRLCPSLERYPSDLFLEKRTASAFFPLHCNLHSQLGSREIKTVIIAGMVSNVCCEGTARDARACGYRVIMAAEANATVSDEVHNSTLFTIYRSFGDVRSTTDIIGLIRAS